MLKQIRTIFDLQKVFIQKNYCHAGKSISQTSRGCNKFPVKVDKTYKLLPDTEKIILVKLKKKLHFKGHAYFEPVSRQKICHILLYLKKLNPLYAGAEINVDHI